MLHADFRRAPAASFFAGRLLGWPALLVATVLWRAASALFSSYAAIFGMFNATYGSLGAVIGFMTWLWISAIRPSKHRTMPVKIACGAIRPRSLC